MEAQVFVDRKEREVEREEMAPLFSTQMPKFSNCPMNAIYTHPYIVH
jgi:hypothetical protein